MNIEALQTYNEQLSRAMAALQLFDADIDEWERAYAEAHDLDPYEDETKDEARAELRSAQAEEQRNWEALEITEKTLLKVLITTGGPRLWYEFVYPRATARSFQHVESGSFHYQESGEHVRFDLDEQQVRMVTRLLLLQEWLVEEKPL